MASDRPKSNATATLLQFAGAAGATLLVLYLFGGLVMWVRFHAAGIPADQTVAALPRELLIVVGLRTLVVELVVFALIAAASTVVAWQLNHRADRAIYPPAVGVLAPAALVAVLAIAALLDVLFDSAKFQHRLTKGGVAEVAGVAVAVVVVTSVRYARWLNRRLKWTGRQMWLPQQAVVLSMPMVLVTATTIGLAYEAAKAPIFPPVKIVRTGKAGPVNGFFVGETSTEIFVGETTTKLSNAGLCGEAGHLHRLVVVPRDQVAAVVMGRSVRLTDDARRDDAERGLGVHCPRDREE